MLNFIIGRGDFGCGCGCVGRLVAIPPAYRCSIDGIFERHYDLLTEPALEWVNRAAGDDSDRRYDLLREPAL